MNTLSQPTTNFIRRGFTLIEILIVVVILGILAAIVVPQFVNAADEANDAAMRSQLQTLRGQCELFYAKTGASPDFSAGNGNNLVTVINFWQDQKIQFTGFNLLANPDRKSGV